MSYFTTEGNLRVAKMIEQTEIPSGVAPGTYTEQPSTRSEAPAAEPIHYVQNIKTSPPKKPDLIQMKLMNPGSLIFKYLQCKCPVLIWLYANLGMQIGGLIVGYDEYMNIVLEEAFEWHKKTDKRKYIGNVVLKADTITLIRMVDPNTILPPS